MTRRFWNIAWWFIELIDINVILRIIFTNVIGNNTNVYVQFSEPDSKKNTFCVFSNIYFLQCLKFLDFDCLLWQILQQKMYLFIVLRSFLLNRCGPCRQIAPKFAEFSASYSKALFLKVDVDQCPVCRFSRLQ